MVKSPAAELQVQFERFKTDARISDLRVSPHCSFCRAGVDDAALLIAGPAIFICDQCVSLCMGVFASKQPARFERAVTDAIAWAGESGEIE